MYFVFCNALPMCVLPLRRGSHYHAGLLSASGGALPEYKRGEQSLLLLL